MPEQQPAPPSGLRHWPSLAGIHGLRALATLPLPAHWIVGSALGDLLRSAHGGRRRVVLRNLARCFPERDRDWHREVARRHYRAVGQSVLASGIPWWVPRERLQRMVRTRDQHHFDDAVEAGRNIILLAPHFVALEPCAMRIASERRIVTMYQRARNPVVDHYVRVRRTRFGGRLFERKEPLRTLVRSIREGHPFYYLPDQDPGPRRGMFAPFFGIPTWTYPILGRLAQMTDAVVIPCISRQLPRGRGFEIRFAAALSAFPDGDPQTDTRHMNAVIENAIRSQPEQYFWLHKRFKTRPEGEPDFYA